MQAHLPARRAKLVGHSERHPRAQRQVLPPPVVQPAEPVREEGALLRRRGCKNFGGASLCSAACALSSAHAWNRAGAQSAWQQVGHHRPVAGGEVRPRCCASALPPRLPAQFAGPTTPLKIIGTRRSSGGAASSLTGAGGSSPAAKHSSHSPPPELLMMAAVTASPARRRATLRKVC